MQRTFSVRIQNFQQIDTKTNDIYFLEDGLATKKTKKENKKQNKKNKKKYRKNKEYCQRI